MVSRLYDNMILVFFVIFFWTTSSNAGIFSSSWLCIMKRDRDHVKQSSLPFFRFPPYYLHKRDYQGLDCLWGYCQQQQIPVSLWKRNIKAQAKRNERWKVLERGAHPPIVAGPPKIRSGSCLEINDLTRQYRLPYIEENRTSLLHANALGWVDRRYSV